MRRQIVMEPSRQVWGLRVAIALGAATWCALQVPVTKAQQQDPCAPPNGNPIVCENQLAGDPASEWDVAGAGDPTIQGFATDISVDQGQTVFFKIDTDADRLSPRHLPHGLLRRDGRAQGRDRPPSVSLPQNQPAA